MATSLRALLLASFMAIGTAAYAQAPAAPPADPQVEALAVEITKLQIEQIDLDMISRVTMQQMIQSMRVTDPKLMADLQSLTGVVREEVEGMMPMIVSAASAFYRENFTLTELGELRGFLSSPTGRKMTLKGQEFGARLGVAMQLAMQQRGPAIENRVKSELRKRGHQI